MRNSLFWREKVRRGRSEKQAHKEKGYVNTKLLLLSITVNFHNVHDLIVHMCTLVHIRKN